LQCLRKHRRAPLVGAPAHVAHSIGATGDDQPKKYVRALRRSGHNGASMVS
jgi:hypothetical protein